MMGKCVSCGKVGEIVVMLCRDAPQGFVTVCPGCAADNITEQILEGEK